MNGVFVTGTDTGVGKTFVACRLARAAVSRGTSVFGFKPIETGCLEGPSGLVGADQELLSEAAGNWQIGALRGLYRFRLPAAPLVAAGAEHEAIDLEAIARTTIEGATQRDLVIVEGAGGWRVPITAEGDTSTLARRVGLPVLCVARAGLGTINHSLLTLEAIERDGLVIRALVLSVQPGDDPELAASNVEQIQRRWQGAVRVVTSVGPVDDVLDLVSGPGVRHQFTT